MLKLLNKITKHVFVLPDEEAIRIKTQDRAGDYEIIDAGLMEETVEEVTNETVEQILEQKEERIEQIELEDNPPPEAPKPEPRNVPKITPDTLNLEKMTKAELLLVAKRLGCKGSANTTMTELKERIRATGVIQ